MVEEILKFTKISFYVILIYGVIFSILFWIPTVSLSILGLTYNAEVGALSNMVGAAVIMLTVGTVLTLLKKEWSVCRIKMLMEVVWQIVVIIVIIANSPLLGVYTATNIIIVVPELTFTLLAILQQEEIIKPLLK
jgi:hypothetical protein